MPHQKNNKPSFKILITIIVIFVLVITFMAVNYVKARSNNSSGRSAFSFLFGGKITAVIPCSVSPMPGVCATLGCAPHYKVFKIADKQGCVDPLRVLGVGLIPGIYAMGFGPLPNVIFLMWTTPL